MDDKEGDGDGFGGDPSVQFHRNEAISAVVDEGFLAEEEDDDYEDLYNDVNVGENFLQSFRKNEDSSGFRNDEAVEKKPDPIPATLPPPPPPQMVSENGRGTTPPVAAVGEMMKHVKDENLDSRVSERVDNYQNMGIGGNEIMGVKASAVGVAGSGAPIAGGGGMRVELSHPTVKIEEQNMANNIQNQRIVQPPQAAALGAVGNAGNVGNLGNDNLVRQGGMNANGAGNNVGGGGGGGGGGTFLFVGDLHWWTTDAELESELIKYGPVKEVKFFDEKASGKSKGYCQVEFFDPAVTTACKEGMNGHVFNGRPCVVAFASPYTVKRMGESQVNRNQQMAQTPIAQARRGPGDVAGKTGGNNIATGGNYQGGGDNNRGFGRGNWGRGGPQGMGGRGPVGPMRNRPGGFAGRGMMGNGGNGFGQGIGAAPPMMHPQAMMGQGFDPTFGGPMGRMGNYGGFPGAPTQPFSGMMSSFPPVGGVGLPGVAPHVNPAFFGRGMPMNGMGMMPGAGMEGPNMGMWSDPNMGRWAGNEHGGRAGESSYGDEVVSDHQYGEVSHDRGAWTGNVKEKDRGSEREWSGSSEKRQRDDREPAYDRDIAREKDTDDHDWAERRHRDDRDVGREREIDRDDRDRERSRDRDRERDRHRDDKDRYADRNRHRDREHEYDDDWDRGRSSRTRAKTGMSHEEDRRSRSRDADYGKRRRLTSE